MKIEVLENEAAVAERAASISPRGAKLGRPRKRTRSWSPKGFGSARLNAFVDIHEEQPQEYRNGVLPPTVRHSAWNGPEGAVIGLEAFRASAPFDALQERFGCEPDHVVEVVRP